MARKKKEQSEELNDGARNQGGSIEDGRTDATGNETRGETRPQNGDIGKGTEGIKTGSKGNKEGAKQKLLERIRNKEHQGNIGDASPQHRNIEEQLQGISGTNNGINGRIEDVDGTGTRPSENTSGNNGQEPSTGGNANNDNTGTETNRRRVKFDIPKLPSTKEATKPITRITMEDVLTKKESGELKPRVENALQVAFGYMDKGLSFASKKEKDVLIWSSISKEEVSIISTSLVETGQRSKVVATLTRRISRDYMKLQLGIILIPRFIMSVQFAMNNIFKND